MKQILLASLKKVFSRAGILAPPHLRLNRKCPAENYSPVCKAMQVALISRYKRFRNQKISLPHINEIGFRVFSQNDEDGIILFIFSVIGTTNKLFIEIGTGNGIECNCANLAINFGWHGVFIDGDKKAIATGEKIYAAHPDTKVFPPVFEAARVNRENINEIITRTGFGDEIDFLSIDIDGMDYWIWDAIDCVNPRLVAVEINGKFGTRSITVPYDPEWTYDLKQYPHYHGASLTAFNKLAKKKGYRLVGTNRFGFNAFFLRNDICPEILPEVGIDSCRTHIARKHDDDFFKPISHLEYVEI